MTTIAIPGCRRTYQIEASESFLADLRALADEARTHAATAINDGHDAHGAVYLQAAEWFARTANEDTA